MKRIRTLKYIMITALIICTTGPLTILPGSAQGAVIYDWAGDCGIGCAGTASATLNLIDTYTPGTAFATSDFVSFFYSSSTRSFSVPDDIGLSFLQGTPPPVSGPSVANVIVSLAGTGTGFNLFSSPTDGGWLSRSQDLHFSTRVRMVRGSVVQAFLNPPRSLFLPSASPGWASCGGG